MATSYSTGTTHLFMSVCVNMNVLNKKSDSAVIKIKRQHEKVVMVMTNFSGTVSIV